MRRTALLILMAVSLGALSWALSGCGGRESISERRRRSREETAKMMAADAAKPAASTDESAKDAGADRIVDTGEAEEPETGTAVASLVEDEGAADESAAEEPEEEPAAPDSGAAGRRGAVSSLLASDDSSEAESEDDVLAEEAPEDASVAEDASEEEPADEEPAVVETPRRPARDESGDEESSKVLADLREGRAIELQEARHHAERGDSFFEQANYPAAIDAYQRALELDPLLTKARRNLNQALLMMDERVGEVPAVSTEFRNEVSVDRQLTIAEIRKNVEVAEAALQAKSMDQAEKAAQRALDGILMEPDFDRAERQKVEELLVTIRREKARLEEERRLELIHDAKIRAEQDIREEGELRYRTVQQLLRKARDLIELKDYEKALEVCERALELDPANLVAKFWISDSKDQIIKQRRLKLLNDRLENEKIGRETFAEAAIPYNDIFVFPEEDYWTQVVRKRSEAINVLSTEDPEWIRRIKNSLEGTRVNFAFDATSFDDVVQQLRTFTGVGIMVDPQVDSSTMEVTMNLQNLTASQALNLILDAVGLTYTFKENVLFVTTPGQGAGRADFAIYNVSDLLNKIKDFEGPELILKPQGDQGSNAITFTSGITEEEEELDPDTLVQLVKDSTGGEEKWADPNTIEYHNGNFLVTAPRELHAEVQNVLSNLRKDADLFVVIEARFIDINDDFLEDIGVDSRALGVENNLGVPWGNSINNTQTGGQDIGFTEKGPATPELVMGQDRWAGRIQHIVDGFTGVIRGDRLTGGGGVGGLTLQSTWLEPFQINVIFRAVQERSKARQLTAPVVTAHNGQRVYVSVITQRAYIADYNLVSGGTGFAIIEVADPEVQTFQEGVILDVDPVISHDKKYITLDVKPTLATLIGGVISTILISLGSFTNVAFQVPIGVPQISLQQSFTSVTVPNGGTVLLGGFKSLNEGKYTSYLPILGKVPILNNLFRRKALISEKRSLVILITARIVDLRGEEAEQFNPES